MKWLDRIAGSGACLLVSVFLWGCGGSDPEDIEDIIPPVPAECDLGRNVLYLSGEPGNFIHPGTDTILEGEWRFAFDSAPVYDQQVIWVLVYPTDSETQGDNWMLDFSTAKLGKKIEPGIYENAQRWPFEDDGHPGMDVGGDGSGCNQVEGAFTIHSMEVQDSQLTSFAATFEQRCYDNEPILRGCVAVSK
jgi:hypothetical protein